MATYTDTTNGTSYTVTTNLLSSSQVVITDKNGAVITTLSNIPSGLLANHILTGQDATIGSLISLLGGTWVSTPGSTGQINILLSALTAPQFYIGGTTAINMAITAATAIAVNVYGGNASFSGSILAGLLSGSTITIGYGGSFSSGTNLASILQGTTINFAEGGGTLVLNAGGNVLNLLSSNGSNVTLNNYDPTKDTIKLQNTTAQITGYTVEGSGLTRTITLFGGDDNTTIATYSVTLASSASLPTGTYNALSDDVSTNPLRITYDSDNTYIGTCFLAGAMILTRHGEKAVETLRTGDELAIAGTGAEEHRPVIWTGRHHVTVRPHLPDDIAGYPVRVCKNAVADGVPHTDLLVTAEHCLFLNGCFVPVRMLVNGRSITYDRSITSYDYYHVETSQHSIITANGLLTESYLDTGNRPAGTVVSMKHHTRRTWEKDAAAPLAVHREVVEPMFISLATRAATLSPSPPDTPPCPILTHDPALHLTTHDGRAIRKIRATDRYAVFMLPANIDTVRIRSRASRPSDIIGPFMDDRRLFGVLVGAVHLCEGGRIRILEEHLHTPTLPGWQAPEWADSRWTTGNAILPLPGRATDSIALLTLHIRACGPYCLPQGTLTPDTARLA